MKEFWRISLIANVEYGVLTNIDDTTSTFSGDRVFCDTEAWAEDADMIATPAGLAYYNKWNGGHVHSAVAIVDKAATCTENGYTGRTFCEGCDSVVDWGTTIVSTGHTLIISGNKCVCDNCDESLAETGMLEIAGKHYYAINGVCMTGWREFNGNNYYFRSIP